MNIMKRHRAPSLRRGGIRGSVAATGLGFFTRVGTTIDD